MADPSRETTPALGSGENNREACLVPAVARGQRARAAQMRKTKVSVTVEHHCGSARAWRLRDGLLRHKLSFVDSLLAYSSGHCRLPIFP